MDRRTNPYAPGAGAPPPELAGRDEVIERAAVAIDRIRGRRAARGLVLHGLRGVGKTVLLNHIQNQADAREIACIRVEAPEERSLPAILVAPIRAALLKLNRLEAGRAAVQKSIRALAGFVAALKVRYQDIQISLDVEPEAGLADSGDLERDLSDLLASLGQAAAARRTAAVLFIDELQYVPEDQLAALIVAMHQASQASLPVVLMAAGLPQLLGRMGRAKSYAERLFEFVPIGPLDPASAARALQIPAQREGVAFTENAVKLVLRHTEAYPYFLQEWGKHSWDLATVSPIPASVARRATQSAINELDDSFFRIRFDRLTPTEKDYMRGMAGLGPGPHRSGDIAAHLGRKVTTVAPIRNALIAKGMLFSPAHGDTAFTVPLFDAFMRRIMP